MFHPSVFILEEMEARGWTLGDLTMRMDGDPHLNRVALDLYLNVGPDDPDLLIGDGEDLARAFGTSAEFWRRLEAGWREWERGRRAK